MRECKLPRSKGARKGGGEITFSPSARGEERKGKEKADRMIRSAAAACSPLWLPNQSSKRAVLTRSKLTMPQDGDRSGAFACRAASDSKNPPRAREIVDASTMASTSTPTSTARVSAEALDRALGYPYARPPSSFVWSWHSDDDENQNDESSEPSRQHGTVHCFDDRAWAFEKEGVGGGGPPSAERLAEELRLPLPSARALAAALECVWAEEVGNEEQNGMMSAVVALGSNAGPSQLARKFPRDRFPRAAVPVLRAMLRGHDVCYAPLISSYGSVTATLHPVEEEEEAEAEEEEEEEEQEGGGGGEGRGRGGGAGGGGGGEGGRKRKKKEPSPTPTLAATSVEVWVTFLTPDLLRRMHETEACYDLQRLDCPGGGGRGGQGGGAGGAAGAAREEGEEEGKGKGKGKRPLLLALGTCAETAALGREPAAFLRSALCYTHQAGSLLLPAEHVSAAREAHGGERGRAEGEGEGDLAERGKAAAAKKKPEAATTLVAVAEVRALNRRFPSLPQRGAQAAVAAALADHGHELLAEELAGVEAWVARNLTDEGSRRGAVALLVERSARRFASPAATRLEQLGSVFGRSVD